MPGYCVAGTVGAKVLAGEKEIAIDRFNTVQVNMQIKNLSFSAHAGNVINFILDAKGILALITMARAKNVMLVHGEKAKMAKLKIRIESEMKIPTFDPANGETITIRPEPNVPVQISESFIDKAYKQAISERKDGSEGLPITSLPIPGCIIVDQDSKKTKKRQLQLISIAEAGKRFDYSLPDDITSTKIPFPAAIALPKLMDGTDVWKASLLQFVFDHLKINFNGHYGIEYNKKANEVCVRGNLMKIFLLDECAFQVSWHLLFHTEAVELVAYLNSLDFTLAFNSEI